MILFDILKLVGVIAAIVAMHLGWNPFEGWPPLAVAMVVILFVVWLLHREQLAERAKQQKELLEAIKKLNR